MTELLPIDESHPAAPETIKAETVEEAARLAEVRLTEILSKRFGPESDNPLDYHNPGHSIAVADDTEALLKIIRDLDANLVSGEDLILGRLEGLAHDLKQAADIENGFRKRRRGENEENSAKELFLELTKYRNGKGDSVFTALNELESLIEEDILVTLPDIKMEALADGTQGLKASQPKLLPQSSLRAWALATADLRGTFLKGRDTEAFRQGGDAEFRELFPGIREELKGGVENIEASRRREIAAKILNWKRDQIGFAKWQEVLFNESLESNAVIGGRRDIREALSIRFDFARSIKAAEEHYEDLESRYGFLRDSGGDAEALRELAAAIGY
ncbi:MAG: hypothetical protein HY471_02080 [Candidatus Sungbacteria bacterium]|nr:hypothetical protein [Candidatus Sungbacteria bacterium]